MKRVHRAAALGVLLAVACLGLSSCASGLRQSPQSEHTGDSEPPATRGGSDSTAEEDLPWASDPYVRRPAGLGGPSGDTGAVAFLRPERFDPVARRPQLSRPISVGVVLVHNGVLANPATLVLELESNLANDEGVRRVVALRGFEPGSATVESLCKLANDQSHDVLLIDLLPGPTQAVREGLWLNPGAKPEAALVAHVVVRDAEAGFVGTPTFPDVWDRLASAHWRLPAPR